MPVIHGFQANPSKWGERAPHAIWETSGALAEETNAFRGRQLKWTEPPDPVAGKGGGGYWVFFTKKNERTDIKIPTMNSVPVDQTNGSLKNETTESANQIHIFFRRQASVRRIKYKP